MSSRSKDDLVFKALSAPLRREILDLLKDDPKTTGAVCAAFPAFDRCTVMQHLGVLADADLVIVQREGRERWNHLNPLPIKAIHDRWIGDYAALAVEKLARLKHDLEMTGDEPAPYAGQDKGGHGR
ncbi:UNVERIFIED_ORG: ArsR family transcriptional regulator [Martelella mediterranea]